jgi:hypothetical protein
MGPGRIRSATVSGIYDPEPGPDALQVPRVVLDRERFQLR